MALGKSLREEKKTRRFSIQWTARALSNILVCWRISGEQLRAIHLRLTYVEVHHVLHPHVLDRYYRSQRSDLSERGPIFNWNSRGDAKCYLVCFESNVSTRVEFYPRIRRWGWRWKSDQLTWPPTSQTVKLIFLYSTVSTLKPEGEKINVDGLWPRRECSPIVGIVVTISPSLSLYRIVVLPRWIRGMNYSLTAVGVIHLRHRDRPSGCASLSCRKDSWRGWRRRFPSCCKLLVEGL